MKPLVILFPIAGQNGRSNPRQPDLTAMGVARQLEGNTAIRGNAIGQVRFVSQ